MTREAKVSDELPRDQIPAAADVETVEDVLRRPIALEVALYQYRALRLESAKLKTPMSELLRRKVGPYLNDLAAKHDIHPHGKRAKE